MDGNGAGVRRPFALYGRRGHLHEMIRESPASPLGCDALGGEYLRGKVDEFAKTRMKRPDSGPCGEHQRPGRMDDVRSPLDRLEGKPDKLLAREDVRTANRNR